AGTPERAALLRSLCDGRRVVIVLDNARDDAQVRDLLPGPGPLVLVTSRSQLRGLTAREAAHRLALGPLSAPATAELLGDVLGTAPDTLDPAEVARLVDLCAGLPLAIRVVAERMARDGGTLADVLAELGATNGLLDALGSGDDDLTDMRAVLSWSYRALDPHTARAFRLLGAQPGRDISLAAVAVLLGGSPGDTRRLLDRLVGAHLLTRHGQDRYGFHDLLRAYAAERFASAGDDPAPIRRLLDWYVATAANARQTMHPTAADSRIDLPDRSTAPTFQTLPDVLAWFTAEHPTLLAWIGYAYDAGVDNRCWQLAWAVGIFFARGSMFDSWVTACTTGLAAARRDGVYLGQAHMLNGLGGAYLTLDPARATQCFGEVRDLATAAHDTFLQAAALGNLAYVQSNSGDYAAALANNLRAHDLYQNDPENVASLINSHINIGHQLIKLGRYEEAIEHQKRGRALVRSSGLDRLSCNLENNIGLALAGLGRHAEALAHFDRSLATSRKLGFRMWIAATLEDRGVSLLALGDLAGAEESLREALDLLVELDLPNADGVRAKLAAIPEHTVATS
ncbi:MAG TPA: tetratricopeptide repeat protein, partial [Pseudonocardiaceae bacterium]